MISNHFPKQRFGVIQLKQPKNRRLFRGGDTRCIYIYIYTDTAYGNVKLPPTSITKLPLPAALLVKEVKGSKVSRLGIHGGPLTIALLPWKKRSPGRIVRRSRSAGLTGLYGWWFPRKTNSLPWRVGESPNNFIKMLNFFQSLKKFKPILAKGIKWLSSFTRAPSAKHPFARIPLEEYMGIHHLSYWVAPRREADFVLEQVSKLSYPS